MHVDSFGGEKNSGWVGGGSGRKYHPLERFWIASVVMNKSYSHSTNIVHAPSTSDTRNSILKLHGSKKFPYLVSFGCTLFFIYKSIQCLTNYHLKLIDRLE